VTREQFYNLGQEVYHVPHGNLVLYVELTADDEGCRVASFKEK
jgi:hypothetical protein